MKLHLSIDDVQHAERDLARELVLLAEHHAAERDVYHQGHALGQRGAEHVRRLRPFVDRYGAHAIDADARAHSPGLVESVRRKAAELVASVEAVGVVLLKDLRAAYLTAQRAEIEWTILLQAARAVRDAELIAVVTSCHEETEQTAKWLRTRIKVSTAQVLATN
jgi:hypothetical protein